MTYYESLVLEIVLVLSWLLVASTGAIVGINAARYRGWSRLAGALMGMAMTFPLAIALFGIAGPTTACEQCAERIRRGGKFCPHCGTAVAVPPVVKASPTLDINMIHQNYIFEIATTTNRDAQAKIALDAMHALSAIDQLAAGESGRALLRRYMDHWRDQHLVTTS